MVDIAEVCVGDKVRVTGTDTYPCFFHVPGQKGGFVAKGLIGTVERIYVPGECDHLDRSDERDIFVAFDEPKKWKAHFLPDELELPSAEGGAPVIDMLANDIQICDCSPIRTDDIQCDRVDEFMTPISATTLLAPDMPIRQAAELLNSNRITGAPVAADGRLVGVLTQFDFLYQERRGTAGAKVQLDSGNWEGSIKKSLAGTVAGAMSKPVAVSLGSDMIQVAEMMLDRRFNHVPVVEQDGTVKGILTSQDVLRHVLSRLEKEEAGALAKEAGL